MAGKLGQSERIAEFKTPLGKNVLVLINIEGAEAFVIDDLVGEHRLTRCLDLARHREHRHAVQLCGRDPVDERGRAWAERRQARAERPGRHRGGLGHERG